MTWNANGSTVSCLCRCCYVYRFSLPSIPKMTWNKTCVEIQYFAQRNPTFYLVIVFHHKFIHFRISYFALRLLIGNIDMAYEWSAEGWFAVLIFDNETWDVRSRFLLILNASTLVFNLSWRTLTRKITDEDDAKQITDFFSWKVIFFVLTCKAVKWTRDLKNKLERFWQFQLNKEILIKFIFSSPSALYLKMFQQLHIRKQNSMSAFFGEGLRFFPRKN